jgi:hypothetical protein
MTSSSSCGPRDLKGCWGHQSSIPDKNDSQKSGSFSGVCDASVEESRSQGLSFGESRRTSLVEGRG